MKKSLHRLSTALALAGSLLAIPSVSAQDISQIAKSDPLIITGAIGTNNTYYHSSLTSMASPLSNTLYASLNISAYGFSMPFSLYYANNNLSFNYPRLSCSISPHYRNWTLHLGRRSMAFSNYVYNLPFNGVGLEYSGSGLRFGAFYGTLRNAVNDDPTMPTARAPQYQRKGYGAKVGVGNSAAYIDLYFFRAKDDYTSISSAWHDMETLALHAIRDPFAEENMVVGLKGRVSLKDYVSLTANAATSVFSNDINSAIIPMPRLQRWDKIFEARYSSLARFAGDVALNVSLGKFNTAIQYKMVQPDYKSLGTSYISNNIQSLGIVGSAQLFSRLNLSGAFSGQEDNLNHQQMYTTRGFVYNAGASLSLSEHLSLSAGYSGYLQRQNDGAAIVVDTTQINRKMDNFTFSPSYTIYNERFTHTISLSASYTSNKDLNPFTNASEHTDVNTLASGVSYGLGLIEWSTDVMTSFSHQESVGYGYHYLTDVLSLGASHAFLEDKTLDASFSVSCCLNQMGNDRNMSFGADLSLGYTLKEVHVFSLTAGLNHFNDINLSADCSLNSRDFSMSLNYNYTFTLLHLKRKVEEAAQKMN